LHMAQLMPLPLTVSCSSKIQIGFTFLVPAHPGSPGKRAVKCVCVCLDIFCLPEWSERAKQITKLWRKVPSDQRAPYLASLRILCICDLDFKVSLFALECHELAVKFL